MAAAGGATGRDPSSPEAVARAYFTALEEAELGLALGVVSPAAREPLAPAVANLLGNDYRIQGVAVRNPSVLDRLGGARTAAREVTVFVEVTEAASGARWQAAPTVPVVEEGGRLYLARPPLA